MITIVQVLGNSAQVSKPYVKEDIYQRPKHLWCHDTKEMEKSSKGQDKEAVSFGYGAL